MKRSIFIVTILFAIVIVILFYLGAFSKGKLKLSYRKLDLKAISYAMAIYSEDYNGFYPYSEKSALNALKLLKPYMKTALAQMKHFYKGSDLGTINENINFNDYSYINTSSIKFSSQYKDKILMIEKNKGKGQYVLYEGGFIKFTNTPISLHCRGTASSKRQ